MSTQAAESLVEDIWNDVRTHYRDLADPWLGWVGDRYDLQPYEPVAAEMRARGASVTDETDLNYEVSCHYIVERDGEMLSAELALLGPYAAVFDISADHPGDLVTADKVDGALAKDLVDVLARYGIALLDAATLRTPVGMPFTITGPGCGTFYQALFADETNPLDQVPA